MRRFETFGIVLILLAALVPTTAAQDNMTGVTQVEFSTTPFAEAAGLAAVTGSAHLASAEGLLYIGLQPNGAVLPQGAVLEGWLVDAGLDGGPGQTNVSEADQAYGTPFGDANFDALVSSAPYALSTGALALTADGQWSTLFQIPDYNFSPYDAVVITLESDGNTDPWDPRPGTPVLVSDIAMGSPSAIDLNSMMGDTMMMSDMIGVEVPLALTPFASEAGLASVTGLAAVYSSDAMVTISLSLNGAELPQGTVLEGWLVDAGLLGGPGITNVSDLDEVYGTPFGEAAFDMAVENAPYALSTGVLHGMGDELTLTFHVPNYNFDPYDAVVITLESDGSAEGFDPRPGTPVLAGAIATGQAIAPAAMIEAPSWQTIPLTNARTGEVFTLADLVREGKIVMVEPMATWCSNCARQQENVKVAKSGVDPNAYVFISLSVETNISQDTLASYADGRGFDWVFAVASPDLLGELTQVFGNTITNPPSTPHFVIYPDGSWSGLLTGYTSPDALVDLLNR